VARVISGLLPSTEGIIKVDGNDVTGMAAYRIARAGMAHVPEGRAVFSNLTVEENLSLVFRQRGGKQTVADSLARTYEEFPVLGERRKQKGGTLSGGQQRLLSLARAFVIPPKLLVADELSLGLAPVVVDAVYDALRHINRAGTAILVVEQQVDRALEFATSAVVLEHGAVEYQGPASKAREEVEKVLSARTQHSALIGGGARLSRAPTYAKHDRAEPRRRFRKTFSRAKETAEVEEHHEVEALPSPWGTWVPGAKVAAPSHGKDRPAGESTPDQAAPTPELKNAPPPAVKAPGPDPRNFLLPPPPPPPGADDVRQPEPAQEER
jgi:branched-chain amino acid transport system ATP-binding protein